MSQSYTEEFRLSAVQLALREECVNFCSPFSFKDRGSDDAVWQAPRKGASAANAWSGWTERRGQGQKGACSGGLNLKRFGYIPVVVDIVFNREPYRLTAFIRISIAALKASELEILCNDGVMPAVCWQSRSLHALHVLQSLQSLQTGQ